MEGSFSHEIRVGIFTVVGLVLFCLSIILLSGDQFFFTRTYHLKIRLHQVEGISRGSVVSLTGVTVGNVGSVGFVPGTSDVEVVLNINRSVQRRITEGSTASVKTQGALGDKYIFIQPGPINASPLKNGDLLASDQSPDLIDMIASKGAELGKVVNVIEEVDKLFASINADGRSQQLMKNLVDDSDNLNKFLIEGRATFKSMRSDNIEPLGRVLKKIDDGQGTLGALINDPALHNRLLGLLGAAPRDKFLKPLIRESIETHEKQSH